MKLLSYQEAHAAYQEGALAPCELTACYIIEDLQQKAGAKWLQGKRATSFAASSSELMSRIATHRMYKFPELASQGLCAWSLGLRRVRLLSSMPSPLEILRVQAIGERCVSLIQSSDIPKEYEGRADFVSHDLCHLEKFYDPAVYHAQVGFFSRLLQLIENPEWRSLESKLDEKWRQSFEHVLADMNGSPLFLWAVLKSALRPALHRLSDPSRPFDHTNEGSLTQDTLSSLCDWFGLQGQLKDDALLVNDRESFPTENLRLHNFFAQIGSSIIEPMTLT